jgi:excisionase family DNA binding protein
VNVAALVIAEAERRLLARCQELCQRLDAREEVWPEYIATVTTIVALIPPERRGLLTTAEMAERLQVTPKTVRRLGKQGKLDAVRLGKRGSGAIRWRSA